MGVNVFLKLFDVGYEVGYLPGSKPSFLFLLIDTCLEMLLMPQIQQVQAIYCMSIAIATAREIVLYFLSNSIRYMVVLTHFFRFVFGPKTTEFKNTEIVSDFPMHLKERKEKIKINLSRLRKMALTSVVPARRKKWDIWEAFSCVCIIACVGKLYLPPSGGWSLKASWGEIEGPPETSLNITAVFVSRRFP